VDAISWIDGVVYLILLLSVLLGAVRGLFTSLFGITALILAIYTARKLSPLLEPSLQPLMGDSLLTPLAAVILVFLIAFILFGVAAKMFVTAFLKVDVGGLNVLGGVIFGFLRGVLFALLFVLLISAVGVQKSKPWAQASTVPLLGGVLQQILSVPSLASYRTWLRFDAANRPVLVDGRKQKVIDALKQQVIPQNAEDSEGDSEEKNVEESAEESAPQKEIENGEQVIDPPLQDAPQETQDAPQETQGASRDETLEEIVKVLYNNAPAEKEDANRESHFARLAQMVECLIAQNAGEDRDCS